MSGHVPTVRTEPDCADNTDYVNLSVTPDSPDAPPAAPGDVRTPDVRTGAPLPWACPETLQLHNWTPAHCVVTTPHSADSWHAVGTYAWCGDTITTVSQYIQHVVPTGRQPERGSRQVDLTAVRRATGYPERLHERCIDQDTHRRRLAELGTAERELAAARARTETLQLQAEALRAATRQMRRDLEDVRRTATDEVASAWATASSRAADVARMQDLLREALDGWREAAGMGPHEPGRWRAREAIARIEHVAGLTPPRTERSSS